MAEAKARKMRTTVHVGTDADARLAIDAGANGLEHAARGLSDETIALMAAKKTTFTPTNVVLDYAWKRRVVGGEDALARRLAIPAILQSLLDPASPLAPFLRDGEMRDRLAQAFAGSLDQTSRAIRAGRADPGRIGCRQSRDLPRRVAHSRARAAGAGRACRSATC